jgi:hypothetical protein
MYLPIANVTTPVSALSHLYKFDEQWNASEITGSCDTRWALDRTERRLMRDIIVIMMIAGAAVYYQTRIQPTIAQSSTEAEFKNMADAGKVALYLTGLQLMPHICGTEKGSFFKGAFLPKKLDPNSNIETQYKLFQGHVLSY